MRIEPDQISNKLRWMIVERAKRPDLADNGFSIDDALLEHYRSLVARQHPGDSEETREAIALYHALFDRHAAHNIEKATTVDAPHDDPKHVDTQLWNANFRSAQANRELVDRGIRDIAQAVTAGAESTGAALSARTGEILASHDGIRQAIRDWGIASAECTAGVGSEIRELRQAVEVAGQAADTAANFRGQCAAQRHEETKDLLRIVQDNLCRVQERTRASVESVHDAVENFDRNLSMARTAAGRQFAEEVSRRRAERVTELRLKVAQIGLLFGILGVEILRYFR